MAKVTSRSEAAKKAVATRKRKRYEAMREKKIQTARRDYLYNNLTDEQRGAIDQQLDSSTHGFDDEFEDFIRNKESEVMDDIRTLLREDVHPALIIRALQIGNCEPQIVTGTGGFTIDKTKLLEEVLLEEEFRSLDVDLETDYVDGINYEDFDIPPAMAEEGGANI